ncbi:MAG: hypothetical protein MRY83_20150, partial [Flavobacteriales bacterium]|nr:hypothetical protein [Flavobacteriales bacterium]
MKYVQALIFSLIFTQLTYATDYYWVGGTGNWSDYGNHWATTSGGSVFHSDIPDINDDVYFDQNSFNASGQYVSLDATQIFCKTMDWSGVVNFPELRNDQNFEVNIAGNLILSSQMLFNESDPYFNEINIHLIGDTLGQEIWTNGKRIQILRLYSDSSIIMSDTLNLSHMYVYNGANLYTNDKSIIANSIQVLSGGNVYLGSSYIKAGGYRSYSSDSLTNNAFIDIYDFISDEKTVYKKIKGSQVTCNYVDSVDIEYNYEGRIDAKVLKDIKIKGDGELDLIGIFNADLDLTNVRSLVNFNCTLNGNFIQGPSSCMFDKEFTGSITKDSGQFYVDHIIMNGLNAFGNANFIATNVSQLSSNSGWTIQPYLRQTLYWVGNTGVWSDSSKWSTSSGGSAVNCVPSPFDTVVFDQNSFQSSSDTIFIGDDRFGTLRWLNANGTLSHEQFRQAECRGSMFIDSTMNHAGDVNLLFMAKDTSQIDISASLRGIF